MERIGCALGKSGMMRVCGLSGSKKESEGAVVEMVI